MKEKRDLDAKKTTPNIDVCAESLLTMLEYWYIELGLLPSSPEITCENYNIFRNNMHLIKPAHIWVFYHLWDAFSCDETQKKANETLPNGQCLLTHSSLSRRR